MSSKIRVLSLLEAYEERQQEAQKLWKKSQWNITKARQSKGADAVAASNVREELRSRCLLVDDTPVLVEEDTLKDVSAVLYFRLVDPVEQAQTDKENAATKTKASFSDSTNANGLRNRKTKEPDTKKEWTVSEDSDIVDEETKLRSLDSVELFGIPTKELRQAKQEAHRAVALYVEAANLMLALQKEIKK
eukprot:scaffold2092_cov144-Amphora_coffeaeformis.AAC.7